MRPDWPTPSGTGSGSAPEPAAKRLGLPPARRPPRAAGAAGQPQTRRAHPCPCGRLGRRGELVTADDRPPPAAVEPRRHPATHAPSPLRPGRIGRRPRPRRWRSPGLACAGARRGFSWHPPTPDRRSGQLAAWPTDLRRVGILPAPIRLSLGLPRGLSSRQHLLRMRKQASGRTPTSLSLRTSRRTPSRLLTRARFRPGLRSSAPGRTTRSRVVRRSGERDNGAWCRSAPIAVVDHLSAARTRSPSAASLSTGSLE